MADVLIRGLEMGNITTSCPFHADDGYGGCYCAAGADYCTGPFANRGADCPVAVLPEGYGRLGDLDKLEENLRLMAVYQTGERQQSILGCCETIRMTKPIVPAEGGTVDG